MTLGTHVRLCLKDLYAQDVVEMIERETRRYELEAIEHPDHPDFKRAFEILWGAFGAAGEMESEPVIRKMLLDDATRPARLRHLRPLFPAGRARSRDRRDSRRPRRSRAGEPGLRPEPVSRLPVAHLHAARGARNGAHLLAAHRSARPRRHLSPHAARRAARSRCPPRTRPGRYYGMRVDLAAEVEFFSPDDKLSLQRILFYGRGGFDVIDPRHFPYRQPDFRDPALIAQIRRPAGSVHAAAATRRSRARGAPSDRRGEGGDPSALRRLRGVLRAAVSGQQPRRGAEPARRASRAGQERRRAAAAAHRRARSEAAEAALPLRRLPPSLRSVARDRRVSRGAASRRRSPRIRTGTTRRSRRSPPNSR